MAKIILTGDRPTGRLHVGHYVAHCAGAWSYKIPVNTIKYLL